MKHYVDKSSSTAATVVFQKKKTLILFFTIGATVYCITTIGINTIIYTFSPDRFLDSALTRGSCFCRFFLYVYIFSCYTYVWHLRVLYDLILFWNEFPLRRISILICMYRVARGDNNTTTGSASVTDKATDWKKND